MISLNKMIIAGAISVTALAGGTAVASACGLGHNPPPPPRHHHHYPPPTTTPPTTAPPTTAPPTTQPVTTTTQVG